MVLSLNGNWEIPDYLVDNKLWSGTVEIMINGVEVKKASIWKRDTFGTLKLLKLYTDWLETESGCKLVPIDLEDKENNYILNLKTR